MEHVKREDADNELLLLEATEELLEINIALRKTNEDDDPSIDGCRNEESHSSMDPIMPTSQDQDEKTSNEFSIMDPPPASQDYDRYKSKRDDEEESLETSVNDLPEIDCDLPKHDIPISWFWLKNKHDDSYSTEEPLIKEQRIAIKRRRTAPKQSAMLKELTDYNAPGIQSYLPTCSTRRTSTKRISRLRVENISSRPVAARVPRVKKEAVVKNDDSYSKPLIKKQQIVKTRKTAPKQSTMLKELADYNAPGNQPCMPTRSERRTSTKRISRIDSISSSPVAANVPRVKKEEESQPAKKKKRTTPTEPCGWYWHVHADGTPVVVGRQASAASSLALRRKRKRKESEDGSEEESKEESEEEFEFSDSDYEEDDDGNDDDDDDHSVHAVITGATTSRSRGKRNKIHTAVELRNSPMQASNQAWLNARWEENFQLLVKYKKEHGTTRVPQRDRKHRKLGYWVSTQRVQYKENKLLHYRWERLNSIGFDWSIRGPMQAKNQVWCNARWEEQFQLLVEYQEKHGTTNVPCREPVLGRWVQKQRASYKKNRISLYRKKKLNSINFEWKGDFIRESKKYFQKRWEEQFQLLVEYQEKHGTTNVPRKNAALGQWVSKQRNAYSKSNLSQERIDHLESIGFEWDVHGSEWRANYKRLICYKKENGNTRVPIHWKEDPQLGKWVSKQRNTYSKSKLSQERTDLLESIGFEWDARRMSIYQKWV